MLLTSTQTKDSPFSKYLPFTLVFKLFFLHVMWKKKKTLLFKGGVSNDNNSFPSLLYTFLLYIFLIKLIHNTGTNSCYFLYCDKTRQGKRNIIKWTEFTKNKKNLNIKLWKYVANKLSLKFLFYFFKYSSLDSQYQKSFLIFFVYHWF